MTEIDVMIQAIINYLKRVQMVKHSPMAEQRSKIKSGVFHSQSSIINHYRNKNKNFIQGKLSK